MCLTTSPFNYIADNDISVYKVLVKFSPIWEKYEAPYQHKYKYKKGVNRPDTDEDEIRINQKYGTISISGGFLHAYKTYNFALTGLKDIKMINPETHYCIVKMTVPKGTEYYCNYSEICAKQLIWEKEEEVCA